MAVREIWIKNGTRTKRPYYYYDTYSTKQEAINHAKWHKKKNGTRNFILEREADGILGFVIPHRMFDLYLDKTIRLW